MANSAMIWSPDGLLEALDDQAFVAAIRSQWPSAKIIPERPDLGLALTAQIRDGDLSTWQIFRHDVNQISAEGDQSQQLRFAAWAARFIPERDDPRRLILFNADASVVAYLRPGMTPDQILDACTEEPPV